VVRLLQREGLGGSDAVLSEVNRVLEVGWGRTDASRTAGQPATPVR
jgi:hypothetical protein